MNKSDSGITLRGQLLDEHTIITLDELCRACSVTTEWVLELVEEGVLEPLGRQPVEWRFPAPSVRQVRIAMRLQRDLGVNPAGAALVLDSISEIEDLQTRLGFLSGP